MLVWHEYSPVAGTKAACVAAEERGRVRHFRETTSSAVGTSSGLFDLAMYFRKWKQISVKVLGDGNLWPHSPHWIAGSDRRIACIPLKRKWKLTYRIWGSHSGWYDEACLLVWNAMSPVGSQPAFRKETSPPSWRSKSKLRKKRESSR
jgi:hypothetical protein